MRRRFIGIDRVEKYAEMARANVDKAVVDGGPMLLVSTPKQQGRSALEVTWRALLANGNVKDAACLRDAAKTPITRHRP
jgi:hypothetical protein